jgi:site-specific recombinase XerC
MVFGLPYHAPHKFRHGHAVYALKMAQDVSALKAVSQNLMHSNLNITDGVYGILSEIDLKTQISSLVKAVPMMANKDDIQLNGLLKQMLDRLENRQT